MGKANRNSLTPKAQNASFQSKLKTPEQKPVPSRSSLKKGANLEKSEEKRVRFSGKLAPEHTPTARSTPNVIVKEVVDSDDEILKKVVNGKKMNPLDKKQGKSPLTAFSSKPTPAAQTKKSPKLQLTAANNKKPTPSKSHPGGPKAKLPAMEESDEEETDETVSDEDDSDLGALWDDSDYSGEDDDLVPDMMLSADMFEDATSEDSEDEKPSTVVIEEVKDEASSKSPANKKTNGALTPAPEAKVANLKRRASDPIEPQSSKRPAPLSDSSSSPPQKKRLVVQEKVQPSKEVSVSKRSSDKIATKTPPKTGTPKAEASKQSKKSMEELLKPFKGKCTPAEYKRMKRKFKAQERKRRAKLMKLLGISSVNNAAVSDKENLIKISDDRVADVHRRTLYLRPIPPNCNSATLKKALPSASGCCVPPKKTSKKTNPKAQSKEMFKCVRGYAFVEFATPEEAQRQLNLLKEGKKPLFPSSEHKRPLLVRSGEEQLLKKNKGKVVTEKSIPKRLKFTDFKTLHVGGLPCQVQMSQVVDFLNTKEIDMPIIAGGNLGFCTARYENPEVAIKIFREKHGANFHGSKLWITLPYPSRSKKST